MDILHCRWSTIEVEQMEKEQKFLVNKQTCPNYIWDGERTESYLWTETGIWVSKSVTVIHAAWHDSHGWPWSVVNVLSLRSHQGTRRSVTGSSRMGPSDPLSPVHSLVFISQVLEKHCSTVPPYQATHISIAITNPSFSMRTSLSLLTVMFMFTPLSSPHRAKRQKGKMDQLRRLTKDRGPVFKGHSGG